MASKNGRQEMRCTKSFGRLALVVCNLWRRFRVLISVFMTSSHHSIHFTSLNCSYTSSLPDISPSSFTKGSTLWGLWDLSFLIWTLVTGKPGFPFLSLLRDIEIFIRFSLSFSFLEVLRLALVLVFFPPTATSSWLKTPLVSSCNPESKQQFVGRWKRIRGEMKIFQET